MGIGKSNIENAFFEFFLRRLSTHPTPGAPCIPRRWRPKPQRTRNDCARQAAGQTAPDARRRPCKASHTLPDAGHAGRSGRLRRWKAWSVSETVQIWTQRNSAQKQTLKSVRCCVRNLTRTLKSAIIMPETNEH